MIASPRPPFKRSGSALAAAGLALALLCGCAARKPAGATTAAESPAGKPASAAGSAPPAVPSGSLLPCPPAPATAPAVVPQLLADGLANYEAGRYAEAQKDFAALDADGSADGMALYRLAFCYSATGNEDTSRATYERARAALQTRNDAGAATVEERFYLVNVLLNLDKPAQAKATAEHAVAAMESCSLRVPEGGSSSFRAGKLYGDAGNRERQAAWYRRALEEFKSEPSPPAAYVQRAKEAMTSWDLSRLGWKESLPRLQAMRQEAPTDPGPAVALLVAQLHLGDAAGAEKTLAELRPIAGRYHDEMNYLKGLTHTVTRMTGSGAALPDREPDGSLYADIPTDRLTGTMEDRDGTTRARPGLLQDLALEGSRILSAPLSEGDGIVEKRGPGGVNLVTVPAPETMKKIDALQGRFVSVCLEIVRRGLPLQEIAFTSSLAPLVVHDWRGEWIAAHREKKEGAAPTGEEPADAPPKP